MSRKSRSAKSSPTPRRNSDSGATSANEHDRASADGQQPRFEFVDDEYGGVTVMRDGHPQSHVDLDDPARIEFEYVQNFVMMLDSLSPKAPAPLGITHIGGAGLTLARYVEHVRPGSPQIVFEPDAQLTEAVRRELPLPRAHRIRVRPELGEKGVRALKDASADVIVIDAFAGGQVPGELLTPSCVDEYARVLKPGGVLLANLADEPGLHWVSRALTTVKHRFAHQVAIAGHEVFKGRRFGNVTLAATTSAEALDVAAIRRSAAKSIFPTGVKHGDELAKLQQAVPFTDDAPVSSPVPPQLGAWRVR